MSLGLLVLLISAAGVLGAAEESVVQIVLKRPINVISDRFISFTIDPSDLYDVQKQPSITSIAKAFGPAYLKIAGRSTNNFPMENTSTDTQFQNDWQALNKWMRTVNFNPIVALPYNPNDWKPRDVINFLSTSDRLGVTNCIWQLGTEFNITDAINYVDDLTTLRTILDAFSANKWSTIGADISRKSRADEVKLFMEMSQPIVDAAGWIESSANQLTQPKRDPILRSMVRIGKVPLWLNVPTSIRYKKYSNCKNKCVTQGLRWAQTLGSAARNGYKVVFKGIDAYDVVNPSLSYYVTLLHKKVIGDKVFDARVVNGDKELTQFFTHCSRNISGSFTVMAVNFAETKTKLSSKMPSRQSGDDVMQYILTVDTNGVVNINSEPVNVGASIDPVMKTKRPNRPTSFTLPPRSVGFWIFPTAKLKECQPLKMESKRDGDKLEQQVMIRPKTTTELLLQQLIVESAGRRSADDAVGDPKERAKRHAIVKKDFEHRRHKRHVANDLRGEDHRPHVGNMLDQMNELKEARKRRRLIFPFHMARKVLSFNAPAGPRRRQKRHIAEGFSRLFEKFELAKQKNLLMNRPSFLNLGGNLNRVASGAANTMSIPPISTVHDVYQVDSNEKMFRSSENKDLPSGDVYAQVGTVTDGASSSASKDQNNGGEMSVPDENVDYVEFDKDEEKKTKSSNVHQKYYVEKQPNVFSTYSDGYVESEVERQNQQVSSPSVDETDELWESTGQQSSHNDATYTQQEAGVADQIFGQAIKQIVPESQPSWEQNQDALRKAKEKLNGMYVEDYPADGGREAVLSRDHAIGHQNERQQEDIFITRRRRKRSLDVGKFNDKIEQKVALLRENSKHQKTSDVGDESTPNKTNPKLSKISLLDKISKIVANIEKIDNLADLTELGQLADEIKDIEEFLLKKSQKLKFFKNPLRAAAAAIPVRQNDLPKKCKILALNLEKQCLRDVYNFPRKLSKLVSMGKMTSSSSLATVAAASTTASRSKRSAESWNEDEDVRSNMIPLDTDSKLDVIVPAVAMKKNDQHSYFTPITTPPRHYVQSEEDDDDEVVRVDGERTPQFMRIFTSTMESILKLVNRHVTGWIDMIR